MNLPESLTPKPFPPVTDLAITGAKPEFVYSAPWHECKVIHSLRVMDDHILVIGDPDNGAYEWVKLHANKVKASSDCGYGISEIALRDALNEALKDW